MFNAWLCKTRAPEPDWSLGAWSCFPPAHQNLQGCCLATGQLSGSNDLCFRGYKALVSFIGPCLSGSGVLHDCSLYGTLQPNTHAICKKIIFLKLLSISPSSSHLVDILGHTLITITIRLLSISPSSFHEVAKSEQTLILITITIRLLSILPSSSHRPTNGQLLLQCHRIR